MRSYEGVQSSVAVQYHGWTTVVVNAFANFEMPRCISPDISSQTPIMIRACVPFSEGASSHPMNNLPSRRISFPPHVVSRSAVRIPCVEIRCRVFKTVSLSLCFHPHRRVMRYSMTPSIAEGVCLFAAMLPGQMQRRDRWDRIMCRAKGLRQVRRLCLGA